MTSAYFPIEGVSYPSDADADYYRKAGAWLDMTAGDALRAATERHPNKMALISADRRISYAEFDAASERLGAALIGMGLRPGDRALFQMGTVNETAIALFACFKAGIVPVCSLPQFRDIEMRELARQSEAKAWFVQADFSSFDLIGFAKRIAGEFPAIRHFVIARGQVPAGMHGFDELIETVNLERAREILASVPVSTEDVLSFQLSGGTTGTPKIIPRFHAEYLGQARDWAKRTCMDEGAISLYALPLIHNAGQIVSLIPIIVVGGTQILVQRMEPAPFFEWIERERVTHVVSIGPVAAHLIDYANVASHDISSIKLITVFNRAELLETHLKVPCANVFGITEGMLMSAEPGAAPEARFETLGESVSAIDEVRVLEVGFEQEVPFGEAGELCFKGPSSTRGYFRLPEVNRSCFTSDGFFRTGDLVRKMRVGNQDCYVFVGRIKDNIDRGGEKFGAEEVENVITRHPLIADAKVVAMPDRVYGEKACAFLIMKPGKTPLTVSELGAFLIAQGLAKFKLPERIESVDAFPTTRVGKLDKAALRAIVADKLAKDEAAQRTR